MPRTTRSAEAALSPHRISIASCCDSSSSLPRGEMLHPIEEGAVGSMGCRASQQQLQLATRTRSLTDTHDAVAASTACDARHARLRLALPCFEITRSHTVQNDRAHERIESARWHVSTCAASTSHTITHVRWSRMRCDTCAVGVRRPLSRGSGMTECAKESAGAAYGWRACMEVSTTRTPRWLRRRCRRGISSMLSPARTGRTAE